MKGYTRVVEPHRSSEGHSCFLFQKTHVILRKICKTLILCGLKTKIFLDTSFMETNKETNKDRYRYVTRFVGLSYEIRRVELRDL